MCAGNPLNRLKAPPSEVAAILSTRAGGPDTQQPPGPAWRSAQAPTGAGTCLLGDPMIATEPFGRLRSRYGGG
ncbi:hypothetical protein GCM10023108_06690 [Saccharopolyspora hordei]